MIGCSGEGEATPDATITFEAAVSAELTRLAPSPTVATNPTPTLAAVATAALPQSEATPTLVPTPTSVPIIQQDATATHQGIEGNLFSRGDVLLATDAPIYGDRISFFLVGAADHAVGIDEGMGVLDVTFSIFDVAGNMVHQKVETMAAYCAFGGDFPCEPYDFAQNSYLWSSGLPLVSGNFTAEIVARGTNLDRTATWTYDFQIQLEQ